MGACLYLCPIGRWPCSLLGSSVNVLWWDQLDGKLMVSWTCDYFSNPLSPPSLYPDPLPWPQSPSSLAWVPTSFCMLTLDGLWSFLQIMPKPFRSFSFAAWINTKLFALALVVAQCPQPPLSPTVSFQPLPFGHAAFCHKDCLHSFPINPQPWFQPQQHFLRKASPDRPS